MRSQVFFTLSIIALLEFIISPIVQNILLVGLPNIAGVQAFAASKKGQKRSRKQSQSSTNKGFGAPPPTLDEVLSTFPTRIPKKEDGSDDVDGLNNAVCPCGGNAGKSYRECCGPFHNSVISNYSPNSNSSPCKTMEEVLRTRYSAFSLRLIPYVMQTTHPSCRDYRADKLAWARDLNKGGMFDSFKFCGLDILDEQGGNDEGIENNENEGFITFKVKLRAKDNAGVDSLTGRETVVSERSRFLRDPDDKSWRYAGGDVKSDVSGLEDTKLNV